MKKRIKLVKKNKIKIYRYGFKYLSSSHMVYSSTGQVMCVDSFRIKESESRYFPVA